MKLLCLPLLLAYLSITVTANDPSSWRGIRIWFSEHSDLRIADDVDNLVYKINIVGGWRVHDERHINWAVRASETNKADQLVRGNVVASAFYNHMFRYLQYNGFDVKKLIAMGKFRRYTSEEKTDGVVGCNIYVTPRRGGLAPGFPAEQVANLFDAINAYWTHPDRRPAYPVTWLRVENAFKPADSTAVEEWPPRLQKFPPSEGSGSSTPLAPPADGWRQLPAQAQSRFRKRQDQCPAIVDMRDFVDDKDIRMDGLDATEPLCGWKVSGAEIAKALR